mmetsp:Transcript_26651/g.38083  ORF Transcript_26651/g.38083 Transcript_26651/m.38083 type:complete len:406 (+) Transcript_26651:85-1302(+)
MKRIRFIQLYSILLITLAVLPVSSSQTRRRKKRRIGGPSASRGVHKSNRFDATLRDKWLDILSLEQESLDAVRLDTRQEQYRYESEILADQLLGLAPVRGGLIKNKPLFLPWTYSFPLAAVVAICFFALPLSQIGTFLSTFLSSTYTQVTPYLMPTWAIVRSTTGNYLRQGQAIMHSMPYFLRHRNRVKINPMKLLYKILKKCIILECWRHIWVRVYKLTSYLWKGTKSNFRKTYIRVVPAFIRRGVKSMLQSMIQGHVHGAMGGLVGTIWASSPVETDIIQDVSESIAAGAAEDSVQSALEATVESITEDMDGAVESIAIESALDSAADAVLDDSVLDSIDSAVDSVIEDGLLDSIDSAVDSVIEDSLLDSIDTSTLESAVDTLVEDCLDGGCIDAVLDSVVDE